MANVNKLRKNRNITALIASGLVMLFYGIQMVTSWATLKSSGVKGSNHYIDQAAILNSAKCFKTFGNEIYKTNMDPTICGNFQYSVELLRLLNFLSLSNVDSFTLGTIFMWLTISILCLVFFMIKDFGKQQYIFATLACISPGVWLLLERGNYDELIFMLVVIAGILLGTKRKIAGVLVLGFSALLKFYTLPAFIFATFFIEEKKTRRFLLIISIPLSLYSLKLISQVASFPSTWNVSFGLKSIGLYLQLAIQYLVNQSFTIPSIATPIPGLIILFILLLFMRRIAIQPGLRIEDPKKLDRFTQLYNLLLIVFLSCYFAGMNYDYRLVFLSFLVGMSPLIFHSNRYSAILVISGLLSLTFSTYLFGLHGIPALIIQMSGDLFLSVYVATQLVYLFEINPFKNLNSLKAASRYF